MKNHIENLSLFSASCALVCKDVRRLLVLLASLLAMFASGLSFGNNLPSVSLTAPAGTSYHAPALIHFTATASDSDGTVNDVGFFVNGTGQFGMTNLGSGNYEGDWGPGVPAGTYTLTAVAHDNNGGTTISSPVVVVVHPNNPPAVSLTSPVTGTEYSAPATIHLTASSSDIDGSVRSVGIAVNGIGQFAMDSTGGSTFAAVWGPGVSAGTYNLTAIAQDDGGATTTSATVTIVVHPNVAPTVSLNPAVADVVYVAPATIHFLATAADSDGTLSNVQIASGGTPVVNMTSAGGGTYAADLGSVGAGTYHFTAVATDNASGVGTSAPVTVTVFSSQPPSVSMAIPNNGTYPPGATIPLKVNAADIDGTVSQVQLFAGATLIGTASLASGTSTSGAWVTNWTGAAAGTYTITAVATDNSTAYATSAPVTVTVTPSAAMSVGLTAPAGGSTYTAPANVALAASATSTTYGVSQVEFFNGATSIGLGTLTSGTATSGSYVTNAMTNVPAGTYTVTAVATEEGGFTVTSSPVTFTVGAASSGANATMYFIEADHLGTPRLIADQMQQPVWKWNQGEPFGDSVPNGTSSSGSFVFNLAFPGQYRDQETNMVYNNARDYDANGGRYVQSDPIGLRGGINTYSYVGGNPISLTDSKGLAFDSITAACLQDPSFCAEIMGIMVQNAASQTGNACVIAQADDAVRNIHKVGTIATIATLAALPIGVVGKVGKGAGAIEVGSFSIIDWKGYPNSIPKPNGPFRLLEGQEYANARNAASDANRRLHAADDALGGWQLHEVQPVKFGGSPTDIENKIPLPGDAHSEVTTWWASLQRSVQGK